MKTGRLTATAMLAVYLLQICGYAATVLMCRCVHAEHRHACATEYAAEAACPHCCHHHGNGHECGEKPAAGTAMFADTDCGCCCTHSHSTEISLYDTDERSGNILPHNNICCTILPGAQRAEAPAPASTYLSDRLKIPLPEPLAHSPRALRAPPVSA